MANKNNHILLKKIPPDEDNQVENCNGFLFRSYDLPRPIRVNENKQ